MNKMSPSLLRAAIVFGLTLVVSLVVVMASYIYMDNVYQDYQSAQRSMRTWKSKLDHSVQKNRIIDEFEKNFLRLVNQGVVGEEDRISWFETIQNTAKKRGMPLVKYSISTQEKLDEGNLKTEYRGIDVFKSEMILDIKMAHEGDLFALLNDLKKADGLYTVDECDIQKLYATEKKSLDQMKAYCKLGWYTFRGANAGKNGSQARGGRR